LIISAIFDDSRFRASRRDYRLSMLRVETTSHRLDFKRRIFS